MITLSHILSSSYIALHTANIDPSQTKYVIVSLVSSGALDLDHIASLIRDRRFYQKNGYGGNLHKARSVLHELIVFSVIGFLALALSLVDTKLAYIVGVSSMVHLAEDVIMGISIPFNPLDKTEIHLLSQKKSIKIIVDILCIAVFSLLWIKYLNGQN